MPTTKPKPVTTQSQPIESFAIVAIILAFIIPPIGFIFSLLAFYRISKFRSSGKALAIVATVISLILTAILIIILVLVGTIFNLFAQSVQDTLKPNQAETALQPIAGSVEADGGQKICSNGDNGYGLDNSTPWYTAYYSTTDSKIESEIRNAAAQNGYVLLTNKDSPEPGAQAKSTKTPATILLSAHHNDMQLQVTIVRNGSLPLYCEDSATYGKDRTVGGSIELVKFEMNSTDAVTK